MIDALHVLVDPATARERRELLGRLAAALEASRLLGVATGSLGDGAQRALLAYVLEDLKRLADAQIAAGASE